MRLPSGKIVAPNTPIYSGSNFTWGEATKNCTRHIKDLIVDRQLIVSANGIERNIIQTAKELDVVRSLLGGRALHINSWYRPRHINKQIGGAKYSRHQYGDGVDIRSNYLSPKQIYHLIDHQHNDGGLGKYYSFVHIDFRGNRARWQG